VCRYQTYDELYGYCYKVAGTVALMTTPVMGINPSYKVPLCGTLFPHLHVDSSGLIKDQSAHTTRHHGHLIASLSLPTGQTTHCSAAHLAACKSGDVALCKEVSQLSVLPRPPLQGGLEEVYRAALALGTANQLTNILRDVGEDVNERNRIYVPLDELDQFGIRESEVRIEDLGFICL
jgi:Squalene/phytoene synthase